MNPQSLNVLAGSYECVSEYRRLPADIMKPFGTGSQLVSLQKGHVLFPLVKLEPGGHRTH